MIGPTVYIASMSEFISKQPANRHLKHSRMGNRLLVLHLATPKYRCLACLRYSQPRLPGILPRRRTTENFRLEVFEAHSGGVSQKALSKTHSIVPAQVSNVGINLLFNSASLNFLVDLIRVLSVSMSISLATNGVMPQP